MTLEPPHPLDHFPLGMKVIGPGSGPFRQRLNALAGFAAAHGIAGVGGDLMATPSLAGWNLYVPPRPAVIQPWHIQVVTADGAFTAPPYVARMLVLLVGGGGGGGGLGSTENVPVFDDDTPANKINFGRGGSGGGGGAMAGLLSVVCVPGGVWTVTIGAGGAAGASGALGGDGGHSKIEGSDLYYPDWPRRNTGAFGGSDGWRAVGGIGGLPPLTGGPGVINGALGGSGGHNGVPVGGGGGGSVSTLIGTGALGTAGAMMDVRGADGANGGTGVPALTAGGASASGTGGRGGQSGLPLFTDVVGNLIHNGNGGEGDGGFTTATAGTGGLVAFIWSGPQF